MRAVDAGLLVGLADKEMCHDTAGKGHRAYFGRADRLLTRGGRLTACRPFPSTFFRLIEPLEDRLLLSTYTVNTLADTLGRRR